MDNPKIKGRRRPRRQTNDMFLALIVAHLHVPQSPDVFRPDDALRNAFAHRATLAAGRARREEAWRTAEAAGAYPATRLEAGRNLFGQADIMGSADLLLSQPVDIFGKSRVLGAQGRAGIASAEAAFRQSALDVQQEVLTAYANLLSAQRLLEVARTQRDLAETIRVATTKRVDARALPEIQGFRATLEVERADGLVEDRSAAVAAARLRFAGAAGDDGPGASAVLAPLELPVPTLGLERPELMTLRAEANQAIADERVARQGWLPDLEIQAGRTSFDTPAQYNARIQLTANLLDWGANGNRAKAAAAHRRAAELALADRTHAAQKDIDAAQTELTAAEKAYANYAKLSEGAQTLLDRTRRGFELGASPLTDVVDAERALTDAKELSINAQLRRDLAVEAMLRAQGRFLVEPR